jgi:hypothetical protein
MNDDRFDDFLREVAQDYHRPPETPKEAIWARIDAVRRPVGTAPAGDGSEAPTGTPVIELETRRALGRRYLGPLIALAAVLLLGVAIGRWSFRSPATVPPGTEPPVLVADSGAAGLSTAGRLAASEHLSRVEALLTDYRTGRTDADFRAVARELLSSTRLWLDAGRVDDARLRALLEDLELVLVQITRLAPSGSVDERALIDQGLAEREIRARLRNAIPAGPTA